VKLFLDANVLFTAARNPGGKAAFVIDLAREGFWEVATSDFAIEEARRNLEVKFPEALDALDRLLGRVLLAPAAPNERCPIDLPEKDRPIFLSASSARCTHLLTGDRKDFGRFMNDPKKTAGVVIQTVADFLAAL
jgi:predicted nucleic acid-binding protein